MLTSHATGHLTTQRFAFGVFVAGLLLLLFGLLFYLAVRSNGSIYGWSVLTQPNFSLSGDWLKWTGSLPSFLHVIAMTLMTYAVLGVGKSRVLLATSSWIIVDSLFEIAQYHALSSRLILWIPDWFQTIPVLDNLRPHLQRGTFDPIDLLAIVCGGVSAWYVIKVIESKRRGL